eukprot:3766554-Pyramimonas_sp.AAC.1
MEQQWWQEFKEAAEAERRELPPLTLDSLSTICGSFKKHLGMGVDQWHPSLWKSLPPGALEEILEIIIGIEEELAWPAPMLVNEIGLHPKPPPQGGDRPIAVSYTHLRAHETGAYL